MTLSKLLATASATAFLAPCLLATAVHAQTAPAASDTAPQASEAESSSGEIIVTARRREESLQDVPVSITAFSQAALTEKAITNAFELERAVPGLQVTAGSASSNFPDFAIRGRGLNFGAAAGSVETYFADVPLSGPFQAPAMAPQYFDLQSLQVLKGPQGTLFGRSTTGGAVLFVPQAPTDKFEGYARVQVGNYRNLQLEGAVNIPLGDIGALRLAGFRWSRKGYVTALGSADAARLGPLPIADLFGNPLPRQTLENQDVTGLRATLLLRPFEGLENSTIVTWNRRQNRSSPRATVVLPGSNFGFVTALYPNLLNLDERTVATNIDLGRLPEENWAVINTTTLDLTENITLKNIFGYIKAKGVANSSSDVDGSPAPGIDLLRLSRQMRTEQLTNEVQLRGDFLDGRLTGLTGLLIDKLTTPGGDAINLVTEHPTGGNGWVRHDNMAYGAFVSVTGKLTDQLSLTAAARHNWVKVSVFTIGATPTTLANFLANPGRTPGGALAAGWTFTNPGQKLEKSFEGDSYNVGLDYQASNDLLIYGGFRHGWKSGGFNGFPPTPGQANFGPETVNNFYAGVKSKFDLGGMPVRLNVEGYYDTYKGKQVSYLTVSPTGLSTITLNVPKTVYYGLDLETVIEPTEWLEISANYSYINAKFKEWPDPTYGVVEAVYGPFAPLLAPNLNLDLTKNPVGNVSPHKFTASVRFHRELPGDWGEISFTPTVSYQDALFTGDTAVLQPQGTTAFFLPNNPLFNPSANGGSTLESRTLVDMHVTWKRIGGSKFDAALHVTNLTDKVYSTGTTGTLVFGVEARAYGQPRMVSFDISTKF